MHKERSDGGEARIWSQVVTSNWKEKDWSSSLPGREPILHRARDYDQNRNM